LKVLGFATFCVILLSAANAQTSSVLIAPANGATVSPQTQFSWNSAPGGIGYTLWVGTSPNSYNALYYNTASGTSTSTTLLPGTTYYATLFTSTSAGYTYTTSTFQTAATSYLTAPANGATVSPQTQFSWASAPGATGYTLWVGTSPNSYNALYYNTATATSTSASLLLETTYYTTLFTSTSAGYTYTTSTFKTGTVVPSLQSPANGATGVSQFQLFTWNQVPNAQLYVLLVSPTNYQTWDMYASDLAPSVTSRYVWSLEPNTYYYATLCAQTASGTVCSNSNFTTGPAEPLPNRQAFYSTVQSLTSQVRLMTQGLGGVASPGTPLYQNALDHNQNPNGVDCGTFASTLADQMTQNDILVRVRQVTLNGADGHVTTEYWDPFNDKWQIADATFGLVYFDPNSQVGQGAEDVNALLLSGNLSAITPLWVTNNGSTYMNDYYLDQITYYNNVYPFGANESDQLVYNYVPNSPVPFLNPVSLGDAQGTDGAYVFQFAQQTDQITINNAGTIITVTPKNTSGWAATVGLYAGWYITSQVPPQMNIYAFKRVLF
jgi:hypothetical protein